MGTPERVAAESFRVLRQTPRRMRLPDFRGVAASAKSTVLAALGLTYHALLLRFTILGVAATEAQIVAQVANIRLVVDGDAKVDASGAELAMIANLYSTTNGITPVVGGVLPIFLARHWEQSVDGQDGSAWGMQTDIGSAGVGSFAIEITLAAGATIDAITGYGEVTDAEPLGRHWCLRRMSDNYTLAGDKVISDFVKDVSIQLYALHINKSGGTGNLITDLQLKVDSVDEIEKAKYEFIQAGFRRFGWVQQTGYTHLLLNQRGRPRDGFPMVMQDMRLTLTTSASLGNFDVLMERIEDKR